SFLFVVNELNNNYEAQTYGSEPLRDQWLNFMPPERADENRKAASSLRLMGIGGVLPKRETKQKRSLLTQPRYQNNRYRPGRGHEGHIVRVDTAGNITGHPIICRQATIFSCSNHLPVIVGPGDASLGNSRVVRHVLDSDNMFYWSLLHISRWDDGSNISYVNSEGRGVPSVVGRNPSWIPSLVPQVYWNPNANLVSGGLSGDLSVLIGLMAFHSRVGRASDVFISQKWHHNRWIGSQHAPTHGKFIALCASTPNMKSVSERLANGTNSAKNPRGKSARLFCPSVSGQSGKGTGGQ
ncbi:uncharacterized protein PODANS_0_1180, partial [Podospora anserina S mat+]